MTIYYLDLSPEGALQLHSPQMALELCGIICSRILIYIQEVLFQGDYASTEMVRHRRSILYGHLDLLKRFALDYNPGVEIRMMIHYIHLRKRHSVVSGPNYNARFRLDEINTVPIHILVRLVRKLLQDCLCGTRRHTMILTEAQLDECIHSLHYVPDMLARLCHVEGQALFYELKTQIMFEVSDGGSGVYHVGSD